MSHLSSSVTSHLKAPNTTPVDAPEATVPADHVMAQADLAGSVLPARHAHGRMATVAVNQFILKAPVRVGDILSFYAKMERIGRTSMTVNVGVYAERFNNQGHYIKVTEAQLTYVAIDDAGKPRPVPVQQL